MSWGWGGWSTLIPRLNSWHTSKEGSGWVSALLVPVRGGTWSSARAHLDFPEHIWLISPCKSQPSPPLSFSVHFHLCSPGTASYWVSSIPQSQANPAPQFSLLPTTAGRWDMNSPENSREERWGKSKTWHLQNVQKCRLKSLRLWPLGHSKWQNNYYSNLVLAKTASILKALNRASDIPQKAGGRMWLCHPGKIIKPFSRKWR